MRAFAESNLLMSSTMPLVGTLSSMSISVLDVSLILSITKAKSLRLATRLPMAPLSLRAVAIKVSATSSTVFASPRR